MKTLLMGLLLMCASCAHVSQVDLNTAVGDEIRPGGNRQSAAIGATTKLNNGVKIKGTYRHRLTDFSYAEQEHGFFIGVSVPIWKQSK